MGLKRADATQRHPPELFIPVHTWERVRPTCCIRSRRRRRISRLNKKRKIKRRKIKDISRQRIGCFFPNRQYYYIRFCSICQAYFQKFGQIVLKKLNVPMDIYVSPCAPVSPVRYHTKILRRHVLTQPDSVLREEERHTTLRHGSCFDPEYDNRAAMAAAYRNRSLIVG